MRFAITTPICLLLTGICQANIWTVDDDGPADFNTIQAAIDAAVDGDEIVVMPGTYTGTGDYVVDFGPKQIRLSSSAGADTTIISGEGVRAVVNCSGTHSMQTELVGFTLTGGWGNPSALNMSGDTSPVIRDCVFLNNTSMGEGIYATLLYNYPESYAGAQGSPTFFNCVFEANTCVYLCFFDWGGSPSFPRFESCNFRNNTTSKSLFFSYQFSSTVTLSLFNCAISDNNCAQSLNEAQPGTQHIIAGCNILNNITDANCLLLGDNYMISNTYFCNNIGDLCGGWVDGGGNIFSNDVCFSDCNGNGIDDLIDIDTLQSNDLNGNNIPDECECLADISGDGQVNITDLLNIIGEFGNLNSPADVDNDGLVGISDLLIIIAGWGACP